MLYTFLMYTRSKQAADMTQVSPAKLASSDVTALMFEKFEKCLKNAVVDVSINWNVVFLHKKQAAKIFESVASQRLGKNVRQIRFGVNMHRNDDSVVAQGLDPVLTLVNMAKLGVGCRFVAEYFGGRIVHLERNGLWEGLAHLVDNVGQMQNFKCGICCSVDLACR